MNNRPHPCLYTLLFAIFSLLSPAASALDFNTSPTAVGPEAGGACAITADSAGRLHSVWLRDRASGGRELKYTLQVGHLHIQGGHQVGDFPASTAPVHLDIAVDHLGTRHLCYIRTDGQLIYSSRSATATSWTSSTIETAADTDRKAGCSIGVTPSGELAIAYTGAGGTLKYATNPNGSSWSTQTAIATADSGYYPSLAFGPGFLTPRVAIAHFDDNSDELRLTERIFVELFQLGWQTTTVDSDGISGRNNDIVMLEDSDVGISYQTSISGITELRYAHGSDGQFANETIESATEYGTPPDGVSFTVAGRTAIVLDAAGEPQIAYTQGRVAIFFAVTDQVRFARRIRGFGWDRHAVTTTGTSGVTNGLDIARNGAGDPTVFLESDSGGDSTLLVARPTSHPFVCNSPTYDPVSNGPIGYSAPGVATAPDGTVYTTLTTVQNGITRFYLCRDSPEGKSCDYFEIPYDDFKRVSASTIAHTSDGLVHIFSMAVNSPNPSSGDLLYTNFRAGVFSSSQTISTAVPVAPSVVSTSDGRLHIAFVHSSGELRYLTAKSGSTTFAQRHAANIDGGRGISIAAQPGGGAAIAYVHPASREVRLITNLDRFGVLTDNFAQHTAYFPDAGDPSPKNAAAGITAEGSTVVFFGLRTTVQLARRTTFGSPEFIPSQIAGGLDNAYVNLHIDSCDRCIGIAASEDGGGTFRVLQFAATGIPDDSLVFLAPGRLQYSYAFRDGNELSPAASSAIDAHGFPVAAFPIRGDGTTRERVLICRRADGLHGDGDNIPLIYENAFLMDPTLPDSEKMARVVIAPRDPGSRHDYYFRLPSYIFEREPRPSNGSLYGEFEYTIEASTDLLCFRNPLGPSFPPGAIFLNPGITDLEPGVSEQNLRLLFNGPFAEVNPRAFTRFRVIRHR